MKHRIILAALLMFGIIALGTVYLMNKNPSDTLQPVDADINFPLVEDE